MADDVGTTGMDAPAAATSTRWESRRALALVVKVVVFLFPIACSLGWAIVVPAAIPLPNTALEIFGWWVIVLGGAIAAAVVAERLSRRLLPLAVLFRLALAFPEVAPSRFSVALRANSLKKLKSALDGDDFLDEDSTPQESAEELIGLIASLSAHDRLTRGHSERVRAYAMLVGEEMGLPQADLDRLQWSALLHDVGKLDVAREILNKPGKLNSLEWETMLEHPAAGERYIESLRPWLGEWVDAVGQHHEYWDGNGYPNKLAGTDITMAARIVSVADAYDVMTSARSYKKPLSAEEALSELKACSGTQFDPVVVRAFMSISTSELVPPLHRLALLSGVAAVLRFVDARALALGGAATAATAIAVTTAGAVVPAAPENLAFTEATPTSVAIIEDETIAIDLATNREASEFSIDSVTGPATATIDDTTLLIEPDQDESGTVTVIVTACGESGCDTTTIVAEIVAVNDPPLATVDEAEVRGGQQSIRIPVLENDSDADDRDLHIERAEVTNGDGSVLVIADATELEFLPVPESLGPWTIEYIVTDGSGGFDRGTVTILDGNLSPRANNDRTEVEVLQTIRLDPRDNDVDDGGRTALRIVEVSDPRRGSVEFGTDWISYTAGTDPGAVEFSYVVADEMGRTDVGQVTVEVTAAPIVVNNDRFTTREDTAIVLDVLANDGPEAAQIDPRTLRVLTASSGSVAVGSGTITYEPPEDAAGVAQILYEVCTAFGECAQGVVEVTVESVNDITTFTADGEIRIPSTAGPQVIPWLAVSSGESAPPAGTNFVISTDGAGLFATAPQISPDGVLSFTPDPGRTGTARTTIVATDPINGRRVFVIRVIIT